MQKLLKKTSRFFAISSLIFLSSALWSCGNNDPMYLNTEDELRKVQNKIENLADGAQIDSVSLRSTSRHSELSSILLIVTDEKDESETKTAIEYIPKQKLDLKEKSEIKKDALHSYKINVPDMMPYIDRAKNMLPSGYRYVDVNNIMYAASPFGEKYYFVLEIVPEGEYVPNDFVEVFYIQSNVMGNQGTSQSANMADACYIVTFVSENGNLEMMKK